MPEPFDFASLVDEFRDEARGQLALLDAALLRVEDRGELPDPERSELLRALHTLKGNAGMLGLQRVVDAVHGVEARFKSPPASWTQEELDALFEVAAALRRAVERLETEGQEDALARLSATRAPAQAPPGEPDVERPVVPEDEVTGTGDTIRVAFSKLDRLLTEVGELVGVGAELEEILDRYGTEIAASGARRALEDATERLGRATDLLRDATMDVRLVPIGRVFERFPSVARTLARRQGKTVRVRTEGEEVTLDKSTVDALGEPLLHLVRNAVDHGIEPAAEREAAGKPPTGTILLRAERIGDRVRVEVADDGAGLDRAAIRARARELGLALPETGSHGPGLEDLILRPGFSTRAEATTVSGRGVGLDVVRQRVLALRGSLRVEDRPGGGTRFVLEVPLTLAILPALLFEADGQVLALPSAEVRETLRGVRPERAGAAEVVRHREEIVPVARIARAFGWAARGDGVSAGGFGIVLRQGARSAAVLADRLVDQREVVVKALPAFLGPTRGVSGATVTPEGRVVLLLDPAGLLDLNLESHRREDHGG